MAASPYMEYCMHSQKNKSGEPNHDDMAGPIACHHAVYRQKLLPDGAQHARLNLSSGSEMASQREGAGRRPEEQIPPITQATTPQGTGGAERSSEFLTLLRPKPRLFSSLGPRVR
jgi:hypothetical protein